MLNRVSLIKHAFGPYLLQKFLSCGVFGPSPTIHLNENDKERTEIKYFSFSFIFIYYIS